MQLHVFILGGGESVAGGVEGGGGGGGEASKLMSRDIGLGPLDVPRKTSGGAVLSSAADGDVAGISAFATLFLERTAARWLTLAAARVDLATFLGLGRVAFSPLWPAAAISAVFTAWGMSMVVILSLLAGWAAASAKVFAAAGETTTGCVAEADGGGRDCFFAILHFFDLSRFHARRFSKRLLLFSAGSPARMWHEKSTQTAPRRR